MLRQSLRPVVSHKTNCFNLREEGGKHHQDAMERMDPHTIKGALKQSYLQWCGRVPCQDHHRPTRMARNIPPGLSHDDNKIQPPKE
jgi:hypothetical protein